MPRSHRRTAWLPFALSAVSHWTPKVGDRVLTTGFAGDPRDRSTPLDSHFIVPDKVALEPRFMSDFVPVPSMTIEEFKKLESTLGAVLDEIARQRVQSAVHRFARHVVLSGRLPTWKAFESRLHEIIRVARTCANSATQLLKLLDPSVDAQSRTDGVISERRAVQLFIASEATEALSGVLNTDPFIHACDTLIQACEQGLKQVSPRASVRGKRNDLPLQFLILSLEDVARLAEIPVTLPSNAIKEKDSGSKTTPFFRFARAALKLAAEKASNAVREATMSDNEKQKVEGALNSYVRRYTMDTRGCNGAFLYQCRAARKVEARLTGR